MPTIANELRTGHRHLNALFAVLHRQLGARCLMVVDAILAGAIVARPELMIPVRC